METMTVTLTADEKKYLWSKVEYRKKQTATNKQDNVYGLLNSADKTDFSADELKTILNSLEYSFRKKVLGNAPAIKKDIFASIAGKLSNL